MDTAWHRNHTTLPTLDEVTASMGSMGSMGRKSPVSQVSSHESKCQFQGFREEMMDDFQKKSSYQLGRMKTIWGMKFSFALRTAFAALLASIYAMHPEVHKAEWQNATVFAPVLAVACVSGPSLGATLHHALEMFQATVIGCLSSMIVNEVLRPVQPNELREGLMLAAFLAMVFFLCSRPWALVQKRVSVGVMVCGTINMSVSSHTKPWWFPWTIGVPCTVGVLTAVIAMLVPPWLASQELQQRLAFQALSQRQVLVEQFTAFFAKSKTHHAAAAHLLETFRDNQLKMKSLLGPAALELRCDRDAWYRLSTAIKFFDAQLSSLRRAQLTTSSVTQGLMSSAHIQFRKSTEESWKKSMKGVAAVVDDLVAVELNGGKQRVSVDLLEHLQETQKKLDYDIYSSRAEIMYANGSKFEAAEQQQNHHLAHVNRMACYFAINELISVTVSHAKDAAVTGRKVSGGFCSFLQKCLKWFQLPSRAQAQDAMKKVISLGVLCIGAWIPEWRQQRPEFIWAFIAASFIFSDLQGSSISTGLGRVVGTVFGGMVGFITLESFRLINWPSKELEISAYIAVCVLWTFFCSLSRSSPRHGYTVTVAGFSIYIMVVGTLESFGSKSSSEVVFQRIQEQFAGAVIYILVEVLLWRKSARAIVDEQQITILKAIKDSIVEATEPHLSASDQIEAYLREKLSEARTRVVVESSSSSDSGSSFDGSTSHSDTDRDELQKTLSQRRQQEARTSRTDNKSVNSTLQRESHKKMEDVYRKGNQALEAAKQGLVAATFEPTWWHKPFPMADFQRLLHTEEKALRLLHVLCAATHSAPTESLDPDVPPLVSSYCHAALTSLEEAIAHLEGMAHAADGRKEWLHFTIDSHEYLSSSFGLGTKEVVDPETGISSRSLGLEAVLQLFAVQRADQKLRANLEDHHKRFQNSVVNSNRAAYCTNTTMFCLLHFTVMMTELADRLRVVWAAEQAVVHV